MKLIDSHCHLDYDYAPKTAADLVREGMNAGISKFITIGTEIPRIEGVQKISDQFENVFHTIGVHPHDSKDMVEGAIDQLRKAAAHPKCKAIGEIGLDYHYNHSDHPTQIAQLEAQLDLALEIGKPIVIHSREGEEDLLKSLTQFVKRRGPKPGPGVIHCFTGTQAFGQACLDLGFYISFSGILTFKKAEDIRNSALAFPLERILVETDSPFLAPIPHRGKKCEPAMIVQTAMKLAEIKRESLETIARATTENTERLFGI